MFIFIHSSLIKSIRMNWLFNRKKNWSSSTTTFTWPIIIIEEKLNTTRLFRFSILLRKKQPNYLVGECKMKKKQISILLFGYIVEPNLFFFSQILQINEYFINYIYWVPHKKKMTRGIPTDRLFFLFLL